MLCHLLVALPLWFPTFSHAAPDPQNVIKVESENQKNNPQPPLSPDWKESLDTVSPALQRNTESIWPLRSHFYLSLGFFADQAFVEHDQRDRWVLGAGAKFRDRSWHRWSAEGQWIINNTFLANAQWEYLTSRRPLRQFWGLGVTQLWEPQKEIRNILETENFYLTVGIGLEQLYQKNRAWSVDIKALWGLESYGVLLTLRSLWGM